MQKRLLAVAHELAAANKKLGLVGQKLPLASTPVPGIGPLEVCEVQGSVLYPKSHTVSDCQVAEQFSELKALKQQDSTVREWYVCRVTAQRQFDGEMQNTRWL